jgi:L-lysine 6-transaminase
VQTNIHAADVHQIIGKHMIDGARKLVVDMEKSSGSWLHDAVSGQDYLDMTSFFASSALGMNHPGLNNPEFIDKIGRVALCKITNSNLFTVELAEMVQAFSRVGIPDYLPFLFLIEGGALAVENALKAAFDWKYRKNESKGVKVSEHDLSILHFKDSFHGRSGYTLSLTNTADPRKYMNFPLFDWPRVNPPALNFPINDDVLQQTKSAEEATLKQIEAAIQERPNQIAGLIIEAVMGEGGDKHFRPEFFKALRQICDDHEIFFIIDEIQTGMGMTGKFWAHEYYGIQPDALCFGKKAQVCGILVGQRIKEVEKNVFDEASRINSTWGGNIVDIVRFTRIIEIIEQDNLLENANKMGARLLSGLQKLAAENSDLTNARGLGLMCAIDVNPQERQSILTRCYANKLLLLACGTKSIRFRPPLSTTIDEVDKSLELFAQSLHS